MKKLFDIFFLAGAIPILIIGVWTTQPFNYYVFLHWYIFLYSIYLIYRTVEGDNAMKWLSVIIFSGSAIIFNPFIPFTFSKKTWSAIDLILLLIAFFILAMRIEDYIKSLSKKGQVIFYLIRNCFFVCVGMFVAFGALFHELGNPYHEFLLITQASTAKGMSSPTTISGFILTWGLGTLIIIGICILGFSLIKTFIKDGLAEITDFLEKKDYEITFLSKIDEINIYDSSEPHTSMDWYFIRRILNSQNEKDLEIAFYWHKKSAEQGFAKAQFQIAYMYEKGQGTKKDEGQAFYWFKKSAEQGDAEAQDNLGLMYDKGGDTLTDKKQAFYWFKKSAEQGDAKVQYIVALMYYYGEGTLTGQKQAAYWMEKAYNNGYQEAKNALDKLELWKY